jgi:pyruvate dehydrogenase E1 component
VERVQIPKVGASALEAGGPGPTASPDDDQLERVERREWLESLDYLLEHRASGQVKGLLADLEGRAAAFGVQRPPTLNTPYVNTIAPAQEPDYPGDRVLERRIKSLVRWNAMVMVVRANKEEAGIGGHISTYASVATLFEVGFNHFFRGREKGGSADQIYFQGHASPGVYARAFLEGRLGEEQLHNFRRELRPGGLSSYPHPWLMPDFWEYPTVSMGLSPLMAVYQARFNRYLEDRGLARDTGRVWAFLGDGEMDEPESLAAVATAGREKLDNLLFVVNCNLQLLDGPVRGNGKIIQELEALFRGGGWNVIKVLWGSDWDPLLARDQEGVLVARMEEVLDGDYQRYVVESGAEIRQHFFGTDPRLLALVEHLSDEQIRTLRRGGHDPQKVYAAYQAAVRHRGQPTVVLAKTIKGYGLGEAGEGKNITHQQKKLTEDELREVRRRFEIPVPEERVAEAPFYAPAPDSPERRYLAERRRALGGFLPARSGEAPALPPVSPALFEEFQAGSEGRAVSTTMVLVRLLTKLLRDRDLGPRVVPIIPDEARTFGMEPLFRQVGIHAHVGQLYRPVDKETLLYYREAREGQILEEGITEAGSMASFIAAGTSYATHGVPMVPFFAFYSMFGFQRIGDLMWAAGDIRSRGFLIGGTAGRTTLAGEGLQHQDGHSHLLAFPYPTVVAYDPAFAYEIGVIVEDGLRRMLVGREDVIYYLTVGNETYPMPPMPQGVREGILRGLYRFRPSRLNGGVERRAQILGSGALLNEALRAQEILEAGYGVAADVWSATSWKRLYEESVEVERWNRLHPLEEPRVPYLRACLGEDPGPVVAVTDYVKALPLSVAQWVPGGLVALGTDGFGRSDGRVALRAFFEVNAEQVAFSVLSTLARGGKLPSGEVERARRELGVDPERPDPRRL